MVSERESKFVIKLSSIDPIHHHSKVHYKHIRAEYLYQYDGQLEDFWPVFVVNNDEIFESI